MLRENPNFARLGRILNTETLKNLFDCKRVIKSSLKPTDNCIGVRFFRGDGMSIRQYSYYTDLSFTIGDLAIVNANGQYTIVQVTTLNGDESRATKPIVAKLQY